MPAAVSWERRYRHHHYRGDRWVGSCRGCEGRELLGGLARAAWETVPELMCAAVGDEGMRPPISLERMAWDGVGEVCYRRKRGHEGPGLREREVEAFDPAKFLARVIMHIPEPRRRLVRYYGWYSNVSRRRRIGSRAARWIVEQLDLSELW